MIFNLVVIFITILLGLIFSDPKITPWSEEIKRKRYIRILSIILILQSGLRNVAVGADTFAYYRAFERVKQMDWNSILKAFSNYYLNGVGKDPGYGILQKVVQYVIGDYQVFLFLIAMLFFTALGNFVYKNTTRLFEALFAFTLYSTLFYNFFSITGHRQTIATAALLFAYEFLKKRKFLPFLFIILGASTIHISCLIFVPFYFLAIMKRPRLILALVIIIYPVLYFNSNIISSFFIGLVPNYEKVGHFENLTPYTFISLIVLTGLVALLFSKKMIEEHPISSQYCIAIAIALFFTSQILEIHGFMRIVQYYSIFVIVLIPSLISFFPVDNEKIRRTVYGSALVILLLLYINSGWFPDYKFFWQEMVLGPNYTHWANLQ